MHTSHPHTAYLIQTATTDGTKVTFALALPANLPVGAYRLELEVSPEHTRTRHTFRLPQELVVLFNPWCPGECVHVCVWGKQCDCVCVHVCVCVCVGGGSDRGEWSIMRCGPVHLPTTSPSSPLSPPPPPPPTHTHTLTQRMVCT